MSTFSIIYCLYLAIFAYNFFVTRNYKPYTESDVSLVYLVATIHFLAGPLFTSVCSKCILFSILFIGGLFTWPNHFIPISRWAAKMRVNRTLSLFIHTILRYSPLSSLTFCIILLLAQSSLPKLYWMLFCCYEIRRLICFSSNLLSITSFHISLISSSRYNFNL